jgi:hypothetical protein
MTGQGIGLNVAGQPSRPRVPKAQPDPLSPDLAGLLREFPSPVAEVRCLTTLPSRLRAHGSFRIRFADGVVVKGRQVESTAQAERIRAIRASLPGRHFPRILAQRGPALIEQWVAGTPVNAATVAPRTLVESGRLLALVHGAPVPAGFDAPPATTARRLERLDRQTRELIDRGAMQPAERERTLELASRHAPDDAPAGIIHRDFCAENLVLDGTGTLHAVDNETMRYDACDFDLARTWYRWPMPAADWESFLSGYRDLRPTEGFERHAPFWCLSALVDTYLYRVRAATADPDLPYRRVRALLDAHADG